MKKFTNEAEHQSAVHKIKWEARTSCDSWIEEMRVRLVRARECHKTDAIDDAAFLLKMFDQKLHEHNAQCARLAGKMETSHYKRDNIEQA